MELIDTKICYRGLAMATIFSSNCAFRQLLDDRSKGLITHCVGDTVSRWVLNNVNLREVSPSFYTNEPHGKYTTTTTDVI